MDAWKFYDITHRDHVVCNPTSLAKLDEVIGLLELGPGARVLDVACGKAELLIRIVERYGRAGGGNIRAVGIDISPFHIRDARISVRTRIPEADIELLEMGGADYRAEPAAFDLACCIGASWIFEGHAGTLRALREAVRPGGQVLVGEPFWRREPEPDYLAWSGMTRADFDSHAGNVGAAQAEGLIPLLALVSSGDDWDRYETLQWRAAARWAAANPDDPDRDEVVDRIERSRHEYLTWGRETLGWALYLFACP